MKDYFKSLSELKYANEVAGHCFFSRDTMKFFGDTMKTLGMIRFEGKQYIYRKPWMGRFAVWQIHLGDNPDFPRGTMRSVPRDDPISGPLYDKICEKWPQPRKAK